MHESFTDTSLMRSTTRITRYAFLGLSLLAMISPRIALAITMLLVFTIGVSHGATDHLVPKRLGLCYSPLTVAAAYSVLACLTFGLYLLRPSLGYIALVVLAWRHFGEADTRLLAGDRPVTSLQRFAYGACPMALALTRGAHHTAVMATALVIVVLAWGIPVKHGRPLDVSTASDLGVLFACFAVAPFPLSFAAYFAAWHAPRHIARLLVLDGDRLSAASLRNFVGDALPCTAAALVLAIIGATFLHIRSTTSLFDEAAAAIFALTVPHDVIVGLMNRSPRRQDQHAISVRKAAHEQ